MDYQRFIRVFILKNERFWNVYEKSMGDF